MWQEIVLLLNLLLALYVSCVRSSTITSTFSLFSDVDGFVCPEDFVLFETETSIIGCVFLCEQDGTCEGIDYDEATKLCHGCKGLEENDCLYENYAINQISGTRMYAKETKSFLVSGMVPISDDNISESSYWGGMGNYHSASPHARYCKVYANTTSSAWVAASDQMDTNQWVQARLLRLAVVSGIYFLPRDNPVLDQFVTSYKLMYSTDCSGYQYYTSSSGTAMVFTGNPDKYTTVTTTLPSPISALCVRIHPMTWTGYIALRFDVIGRYQ